MRRSLLPILLAWGCGRVNFAIGDAATGGADTTTTDVLLAGHDEDGDGIDDAIDLCPHLPDATQPQADQDSDLVGDACDPEPTAANQQWQLFAPLTADNTGFVRSGMWTLNPDDWSFVDATTASVLNRVSPSVTNVDVWVGVTFESVAVGPRQAAIVIHNGAANPYYYGELYEDGAGRVNVIEYNGSAFMPIDSDIFGGTFPLGYTTLQLQARTGVTASYMFQASTQVGQYMAAVATPNYTGAANTFISFGNTTGRVHYIAVVVSN